MLQANINNVCGLPPTKEFGPGQQMATNCGGSGGFVPFTQNTEDNITAGKACDLLKRLQQHGCTGCGSIPIDLSDDVKNGQLTVNFVSKCN